MHVEVIFTYHTPELMVISGTLNIREAVRSTFQTVTNLFRR
jgi:hypothetical protein